MQLTNPTHSVKTKTIQKKLKNIICNTWWGPKKTTMAKINSHGPHVDYIKPERWRKHQDKQDGYSRLKTPNLIVPIPNQPMCTNPKLKKSSIPHRRFVSKTNIHIKDQDSPARREIRA